MLWLTCSLLHEAGEALEADESSEKEENDRSLNTQIIRKFVIASCDILVHDFCVPNSLTNPDLFTGDKFVTDQAEAFLLNMDTDLLAVLMKKIARTSEEKIGFGPIKDFLEHMDLQQTLTPRNKAEIYRLTTKILRRHHISDEPSDIAIM